MFYHDYNIAYGRKWKDRIVKLEGKGLLPIGV